jgi:hypothetical protein
VLIVGAIISELLKQSHEFWQVLHAVHDDKRRNDNGDHLVERIDLLGNSIHLRIVLLVERIVLLGNSIHLRIVLLAERIDLLGNSIHLRIVLLAERIDLLGNSIHLRIVLLAERIDLLGNSIHLRIVLLAERIDLLGNSIHLRIVLLGNTIHLRIDVLEILLRICFDSNESSIDSFVRICFPKQRFLLPNQRFLHPNQRPSLSSCCSCRRMQRRQAIIRNALGLKSLYLQHNTHDQQDRQSKRASEHGVR